MARGVVEVPKTKKKEKKEKGKPASRGRLRRLKRVETKTAVLRSVNTFHPASCSLWHLLLCWWLLCYSYVSIKSYQLLPWKNSQQTRKTDLHRTLCCPGLSHWSVQLNQAMAKLSRWSIVASNSFFVYCNVTPPIRSIYFISKKVIKWWGFCLTFSSPVPSKIVSIHFVALKSYFFSHLTLVVLNILFSSA